MIAARVQKDSPIPVYLQISEAIRHVLKDISMPVGTHFPPERVMCEHVGVSKMTLRQAYALLEREGLIQCRRGVGTFVAPSRVDKNLPEMRSFTEEMVARGKAASSRLLSFRLAKPCPATREFFGLAESDPVYDIKRLRLGDGVPVALERVELPAPLFPNLERFDLATQSVYKVLEEHYGIQLRWCDQEVSAVPPDKLHRRLLEIHATLALLVIKRKSYTVNDIPVELAVTAYRGDIYTASMHSKRVR
ncbi:MAG TPA: GntR family transcriptional regulator [Bryobacteraceae bacterium]|nr:GntR family transcriptional regulator [Bryobacteraceae bacterium]